MGEKIINGVDVEMLGQRIHAIREDTGLAELRFQLSNRWSGDGGHNESTIGAFYGMRQEQDGRRYVLAADEPAVLLGRDRAPNPVEHLLHALASCMTTALVYQGAARGIRIESCECTLVGHLDVRGFMGIAEDVRPGYERIEARFRVKSSAPVEELRPLVDYSPVYDVVSHGTKVEVTIEPAGEPAAKVETAGEEEEESAGVWSEAPPSEIHPT